MLDKHYYYSFLFSIVLTCLVSLKILLTSKESYNIHTEFDSAMVQEEFTEESSLSQPNIIFILADDMSWTSLGDDNSSLIFTTPNLRRLAEKGLVIENYYALQLCNPSRAALLTGRYPLTIGMQYGLIGLNEPWGVHLNETFMSEVFSQNGYATHMLGKWDLGFYTPQYLPTARGFDSYLGYLYSVNYYYSKICPADHNYTDMTFSTTECYYEYNNDDMRKYSTYFYKDHAIDIINNHDTSKPLFLYLAFQAVHSPFIDVFHDMELSPSYLDEVLYNRIMTEVDGDISKVYAMTLSVLDQAVGALKTTLVEKGMMDNTLLVFASDNGGCPYGGGKNGPLRGTKGTVFEGGTKVDAFIYSPLLSGLGGAKYHNLFHVTDWFPTLLDFASISYEAKPGFELDGVSHYNAFFNEADTPRHYMLYNSFYNVPGYDTDLWTNLTFAVRYDNYKLIHFFENPLHARWYFPDSLGADDDVSSGDAEVCNNEDAAQGVYTVCADCNQDDIIILFGFHVIRSLDLSITIEERYHSSSIVMLRGLYGAQIALASHRA